jgi:hypothetical protein
MARGPAGSVACAATLPLNAIELSRSREEQERAMRDSNNTVAPPGITGDQEIRRSRENFFS